MITRRSFLHAASSLAAAAPFHRSPNDTIRVAVLGLNGRGRDLTRLFMAQPNTEIVALCDPDANTFGPAIKLLEAAAQKTPRTESDLRRVFDAADIDAVAIATPDHWHALATILACQSGKDVYVEKPACHNVREGRLMVRAARKHNRVVQLGTQRRSAPYVRDAVEYVRSGRIGKVGMARAWIHQKRRAIGHAPPSPPPPNLDWALWQGPAPAQPFHANRVHYNWHWFWHYGTGELGNNGIHGLDVARWGLGDQHPIEVSSGGGKFAFDDDQEVPDTQLVTWRFPTAVLSWEHRMWSDHGEEGSSFGVAWYGENATVVLNDRGWSVVDGPETVTHPSTGDPQAAHVANFLQCVRDRAQPAADIETGHLSTRLCHLGNIAYRLARTLPFDPDAESFPDDPAANRLLEREYSPDFPIPTPT